MKELNQASLLGLIERVEDRYVTLAYSLVPIKNGEVDFKSLDRRTVIKMNGYARMSLIGPEGVTQVEAPIADIVNVYTPYLVIKYMLERVAK